MKPKAIIVGLLVDLGGSTAVGIALGIVVAVIGVSQGITSPEDLRDLGANVHLKAIGLIGTTLSTCLGGFAAARMSRPHGVRNAVAVGVLSLALGIVLALAMPGLTPKWKVIAGLILTLPAAFVGGRLGNRNAQPSPPAHPEGHPDALSGSAEA